MRNVMTPERWQQVDHLLEAMLDVNRANRAGFLDSACGGDEALRQEVESLLVAHDSAEGFIEELPPEEVAELFNGSPGRLEREEVLGHYKVIEMLGAGGMGEIYLAEDSRLGRRVALKLLPAHFTRDGSRLRRFEQEARAASALSHPNVCTIHEVGKTDEGRHYIVMEYVEGDTLQEKVAKRRIKIAETLDISIQIASALQAAHEAGVIHRDIKPANIMVRGDGYVKVLDFGLAKLTERRAAAYDAEVPTRLLVQTEAGIVMGTASYMSPEQARGVQVNARTDVWSLGVVLYEMVAGRLPFAGETMTDLLVAIVEKDPPPLASQTAETVPADLDRIITKALSKDREARYQTCKELLVDLRRLRQQLEIDSHHASGAATANKAIGFTTRRALITAIVLMMILVGAIAYAWPWRQTPPARQAEIKSLAVLPFENIGGDPEDEYLSAGITDELITRLTKLPNLRLVSRSLAMRYKDSPMDAAEIGRELGVEAVLDGTVRKSGDRFRVSIHLVNAQDGFELWADNDFESALGNLLDAERQLAEAVASKLKGQLTPQERALVAKQSTTNVAAYEYLLRGKQCYASSLGPSSPGGNRTEARKMARRMFERAIELDSSFADAYAWLALALYSQFHQGNAGREMLDDAVNHANKALALDPNQIVARRALINIYHSTGQTEGGLKQAKRALEINPEDSDAIQAAAHAYYRAGMLDRAISLYQKALGADPTDPVIRNDLARCLFNAFEYQQGLDVLLPALAQGQGDEWLAMVLYSELRQYDKAIEMGKSFLAKDPTAMGGWFVLGIVYKKAGQVDQARKTWEEGARRLEVKVAAIENVRTRIWLGLIYAQLGQQDKALRHAERALVNNPDDPWALFQTCLINARLDNHRRAVDYLKQAVANGFLSIHYVRLDLRPGGALYGLRDDPEFQAVRDTLEQRVGQLSAQY